MLFSLFEETRFCSVIKKANFTKILKKIYTELNEQNSFELLQKKIPEKFKKDFISSTITTIFKENEQIVFLEEFLSKTMNSPTLLILLKLFESMISPLTFDVLCKMKSKLYEMPIDFICIHEKREIPLAIQLLCIAISKKGASEIHPKFDFKEISPNDATFRDSICESIHSGCSEMIDLDQIPTPILLLSLKKILKNFNEPLLTLSVSNFVVENFSHVEQIQKHVIDILRSVPLLNLKTLFCVLDCLFEVSENSTKMLKKLAVLFASCFVGFKKNAKKSVFLFVAFLIANVEKIVQLIDIEDEKYSRVISLMLNL